MSSAEVCGAGPCASGICGTADFDGSDLSLDLPATFFPALVVLPAAFAVCVLLTPRAIAVSVARVTASRLAPASAATSADRYRVCKADCPQKPRRIASPQDLRRRTHPARIHQWYCSNIWAEKCRDCRQSRRIPATARRVEPIGIEL